MRSIRKTFGASKVALENTDDLSPEAAAAIGAGDKSIPLPKKDGEVPANIGNGEDPVAGHMDGTKGKDEPSEKKDIGSSAVKQDGEVPSQLSNGEDPTVSIAKGEDGKPPKIAGTAGALESRKVKAPKGAKFTPLQRARIKVALEDDGMTSEEAEAEIRKQEEGVEDVQSGVPAEGSADGGDSGAAAAAEAGAGGEAAVPPVEGAEVPPAAEAGTMPADAGGDPAEAAAGAEAADGGVPGQGGEAALSGGEAEVPTGEAGADLGADAGSEVPAVDAGAEAGASTPEDLDAIDPVELENARALVARAEGRAPMAPVGRDGRPVEPMEPAGGEEAGGGLPTEVEAEAEQETSGGLEGELLEVADAEKSVDEVADQVEAGREVVEALEQFRESLKIATESGGLDRHGAAVFKIAFEGYMKRLDIPTNERPHILSLESFGGVSKKISATQVSLESIGTALKTVWDKIWKALVAAGQFLMQLGDKLTNAATQLEGRANKLAQQAQSTQGQPAKREIENAQVAEALAIGAKVDVNGLAKLNQTAKGLYAGYQGVLNFAAQAVRGFGSGDMKMKLTSPWGNEVMKIAKQRGSEDGLQIFASEVLPGNQEIIFKIASGDNLGDSTAGMDEVQAGQTASYKLPVLSQPQAGTVAKQVAELAATIKEAKRDIGAAAGVMKELAALAKKFASQGGQGGEGEQGGEGNMQEASKAACLGLKKALEEPFKEFNIYALRTGNAALNWVEASLKEYGAAPAAAKPAGGEAPMKAAA